MKISLILDINKVSFFLLVLPHLAFNFFSLYYSPFFSYSNLFLLITIIVCADLLIKKILLTIPRSEEFLSKIIVTIVVFFFYGIYISSIIQKSLFNITDIVFRARSIILFLLLVFVVFQIFVIKTNNYNRYLNIFLLVFGSINLLSSYHRTSKGEDISKIKNQYQQVEIPKNNNKSLILLVCDEYNSPDGLFSEIKDYKIYRFSHYLSKNNWIVRNNAYTYETSTIHSLSSLFNFNLSKAQDYSKYNIFDIGASKLMEAALFDSLNKKDVTLINFGIFDIGSSKPIFPLVLYYPRNFKEHFFYFTSYASVLENIRTIKNEGIKQIFHERKSPNEFILEKMTDSLKSVNKSKTFVYAHLYMPHAPMKYKSEFVIKPTSNYSLGNYISYWQFTNKKLEVLLTELARTNDYRIILTGDHGYRGDKRINAKNTFMAFYGFSKQDLKSIESVQDLGSLINACY